MHLIPHTIRALILGLLAVGLTLVCGLSSTRWIDKPFPGFVVLENRVIASVSLPDWTIASQTELYQHAVVAVNDQEVATSDELYAAVRELPAGSPVVYTLEKNLQTSRATLASQMFSLQDYVFLFGAYLINGLGIALIGIIVWGVRPTAPASPALLSLGLTVGLWAITATDLYSPHWFFHLHVLGEALLPASFIHLALVFPVDRRPWFRAERLWLPYLVLGAVAVVYEVILDHPTVYSLIHNLSTAAAGLSVLFLIGKIGWDYWVTHSSVIRQQIRVMLLGSLAGYSFPAVLAMSSSLQGGAVAINYVAFTAFFFPLSIGYVVSKYGLLSGEGSLGQEAQEVWVRDYSTYSSRAARREAVLLQRMWHKGRVFALVLMILGLAVSGGLNSLQWINASFPGFMVLGNRVIPSVSLPDWSVASHTEMYQQAVTAVNGQPVHTSAEVYAAVRQLPSGTAITYTLEKDGQTTDISLPSQTFTPQHYWLLFGIALINGIAFACIGLGVWGARAASAAGRALFLVGVSIGIFSLTVLDLYTPYWFFRLHALSEAVFPACLMHLALVFPRNRLRHARFLWLAAPYLVSAVLAGAYQVLLYHPGAYSVIHNLCMVYAGLACLVLIGSTVWHYMTSTLQRVRQQIRVVILSCVSAYGLPAVLMVASGLIGGSVSVNYVGFTAFLFPMALGLVILQRDLSSIEVVMKRGAYALTSLLLIAFAYGALSTPAQAATPVVHLSERLHVQESASDIVREAESLTGR